MLFLNLRRDDHHDDDHDDQGGLHRDLLETGAAMDRRRMLRTTARLGVVYENLTAARSVSNKIATSQIALPKAACDAVYATSGYSPSVRNLSQISLATDNVFSDGASLELATVTGDVTNGMTAALTVAV